MKHYTKLNRAAELYSGFKGPQTLQSILDQVPDELVDTLTSRQLALVMEAVHKAYHAGKASTGAEMIDDNVVWINSLNRGIEWTEEGAEYERQEVTEMLDCGRTSKTFKYSKVKDGTLKFKVAE